MQLTDTLTNPERELSLLPFWFWNDELDESEILRQIDEFERHGVYGFVIHPRVGLPRDLAWMSAKLLHFYRVAIDEARRRGMRVVLYDEGVYPSGSAAGQVVAENPAHACRGLAMRELAPGTEPVLEQDENLVAVVNRVGGGRIAVVDRPVRTHIRGAHYVGDGPAEDRPPAADLLNPAAVEAFIRLSYGRFQENFADAFGETICAIFTDEPSALSKGAPKGVMPGTTGILAHVNFALGYDFTPHLPALWFDDEPDAARHRAAYLHAVDLRLQKTYYAPLSKWCADHAVALTGHPYRPDDLGALRFFNIPGQDVVWRRVLPDHPSALEGPESTAAKCVSSAMVHSGRRRNALECYGSYGHELTWDEMVWLALWAFARGVNLLYPHAFFYSIRGMRRDERPPDVGPNAGWWNDYPRFSLACRRLAWLNTDSQAVCEVAILGVDGTLPWRAARRCLENQIDFAYVNEDDVVRRARAQRGQILLGKGRYRVVVVESEPSDAAMAALLAAGCAVVRFDQVSATGFVDELRRSLGSRREAIFVDPGSATGLRVRQVVKGRNRYALLFNESATAIDLPLATAVESMPDLMRIDPFSGDREIWPFEPAAESGDAKRRLRLAGHRVLVALHAELSPVGPPDRLVRWETAFSMSAATSLIVFAVCEARDLDDALALLDSAEANSPGLNVVLHVINPKAGDVRRLLDGVAGLSRTRVAVSSETIATSGLVETQQQSYVQASRLIRLSELASLVDAAILCLPVGATILAPIDHEQLGDKKADLAGEFDVATQSGSLHPTLWLNPTLAVQNLLWAVARDVASRVAARTAESKAISDAMRRRLSSAVAEGLVVSDLDPKYAQPDPVAGTIVRIRSGDACSIGDNHVRPVQAAGLLRETARMDAIVESSELGNSSDGMSGDSWRSRAGRMFAWVDGLFLLLVALPTVLALVYYVVFASDLYISESRFVVRSPQRSLTSGLGALLQGTVLSRSQDDTYSVHDFIQSRDALHQLQQKLRVREAYSDHAISVFNRFPGLSPDDSFEAFFHYYQNHVQIDYDTVSSISVLTVSAYTAADARNVNEQLLEMGERLVNNVNLRARKDLIDVAMQEVQQAESKSKEANAALSAFRSGHAMFDPERQGEMHLATINKLQDQLFTAQAQLTQLLELSPTNPQIPPLKTQIAELRRLIADESSRITGPNQSLATVAPGFERLMLDKAFADKRLEGAMAALDSARSEVARKQLYLERLVEPNLPDVALEPRRLRGIVTTFIVGLLVWAVASLIAATVREHTD